MYDYHRSQCFNMMTELQNRNALGQPRNFKNTIGVDEAIFFYLYAHFDLLIERQSTNWITLQEMMYVTLTYLTTYNLYKTPRLAWTFSVLRNHPVVSTRR